MRFVMKNSLRKRAQKKSNPVHTHPAGASVGGGASPSVAIASLLEQILPLLVSLPQIAFSPRIFQVVNFIGKAVFICLVGSVNLVLKFQGMFFSAGWTPQNYST